MSPGRKPYWGQAILRKYIRPKAQELGIEKKFGWHTFRHTYSTLLRSVGTEFKVMQELLRHSSLRSTLDVYTQAITPAKHAAQAAVMSLVFSPQAETGGEEAESIWISREIEMRHFNNWGAKGAQFRVPFAPQLISANSN